MSHLFGRYFRSLRGEKGVSQNELARQAGLAVRTLVYWECGKRLPRALELQNALDALAATPQEQRQAFFLSRAPCSEQPAPHEKPLNAVLLPEQGSPIGLSDLLHALRKRKGWTQEQTATVTGVSRLTILRWETAQGLPSEESLERVCGALDASLEETRGLRVWRTLPLSWKPKWSLEEYEIEIARFRRQVFLGQDPLTDLVALTLKYRLPARAGREEEVLRLSALLESEHGAGLEMQNKTQEARSCIRRALQLFRAMRAPQQFWAGALNLASMYAVQASGNNRAGAKLLEKWLPLMSSGESLFLLCDMALYVAQDGHREEAHALLLEAQRALQKADAEVEIYYRLTYARVRLHTDHSVEAIDWLMEHEKTPHRRLSHLLMWTESLLAAGESGAASRYLAQAGSELIAEAPPELHHRFTRLTNHF